MYMGKLFCRFNVVNKYINIQNSHYKYIYFGVLRVKKENFIKFTYYKLFNKLVNLLSTTLLFIFIAIKLHLYSRQDNFLVIFTHEYNFHNAIITL